MCKRTCCSRPQWGLSSRPYSEGVPRLLLLALLLLLGPPVLLFLLLGVGTFVNIAFDLLGLGAVPEGVRFLLALFLVGLGGGLVVRRMRRGPASPQRWARPLAWVWLLGTGFLTVFLAAMATDSGGAEGARLSGLLLGTGGVVAALPLVLLALTRARG